MVKIDENELKLQADQLQVGLDYYEKYGAPLVDEYSAELDEKVTDIKTYLDNVRKYDLSFDVPSLQKICIDLSATIYFTSDRLEKLGVLEDLANIRYKDRYNEAYLTKQGTHEAGTKYSVEQLRNYAEQEAISEKLISFIYGHAAKIIKGKLDAAENLLKACSKCLSAAINEMQSFNVTGKFMK